MGSTHTADRYEYEQWLIVNQRGGWLLSRHTADAHEHRFLMEGVLMRMNHGEVLRGLLVHAD